MSGIGVILNPYSSKYRNDPAKLKHMTFIVGDKASCKSTQDLDDLARVAEEYKSRSIDILAISGGDGTIHCTLSTFIRIYGEKPMPKVTFLRGGTVNTVAGTMNIRGQTESLLSDLLVRYHEDIPFNEKKLRLMKIDDHYYGCLFGIGLIYNFMAAYYDHPSVSPWVAAKTLARTIYSGLFNGPFIQKMFKRFNAEVEVNGKRWPFANYNAIYSGSIRQFGLNFNNFHFMLKQNDGFHACGLSMTARAIIPQLPKMRAGIPCGHHDLIEEPAFDMKIRLEKPMHYMIDGDMLPAKDFYHVQNGPELTVLT